VSESGSETTSDAAVVDPQVHFERAVARRRSRKRVDVVDLDVASASSGAVRFHLRHDVHAAADRISLRHAPSYRQRALLSAEDRSRTTVDRTRPPSPSYVSIISMILSPSIHCILLSFPRAVFPTGAQRQLMSSFKIIWSNGNYLYALNDFLTS